MIAERALRLLPLIALGNFLLAAPALIISLAVAYFTFVQAEATQKMQIASVWPQVSYTNSDYLSQDGQRQVELTLTNNGVGPARVHALEIRYRGQPQPSFRALLQACCANDDGRYRMAVGTVVGEVMRPGAELLVGRLEASGADRASFERYNRARLELEVRLCYCSVFDDCWIAGDNAAEPQPVTHCPTDWVQFNEDEPVPQSRN